MFTFKQLFRYKFEVNSFGVDLI